MGLLKVEKRIVELSESYNHPDKERWEYQWRAVLENARATDKPWLRIKKWRDHEVDYELQDDWLERLNLFASLHGAKVISTCAGHPHGISGFGVLNKGSRTAPSFSLIIDSYMDACLLVPFFAIPRTRVELVVHCHRKYMYLRIHVKSEVNYSGKNQQRIAEWWEEILASFSNFCLDT